MHPRRVIAAFFLALIFASCGFPFGQNSSEARQLVERFAGEWARLNADAYGDMYSMLTPQVKAANSKADFVQRYEAVTDRMALQRLSWRASEPTGAGDTVTVPLLVRYSTRFVGDFSRNVNVKVARQGNGWAIAWGPEVILPELARDGHLRESHQIPARGRILTRDGTLLAETDDHGLSVGVVTGHVTDEASMLQSLSKLLGMSADDIKRRYAGGQPDWFMPVRTLPPDTPSTMRQQLSAIPGVEVHDTIVRFYPQHQAAAHLIGYVSADGTAQAGLEKSLDKVLAGTLGGRLWVVDSAGNEVSQVAQRKPVVGQDAVLSIDWKVQQAAESALNVDPKDAAVVEDPRNGELLAIASHPSFDPNAFSFGRNDEIAALSASPDSPLLSRATSGQYPAGSTFKPITALTALRVGVLTPEEKIDCPHHWEGYGPPGQDNHETSDLGPIDLSTAIARSCNTYFYEVGKRLNDRNHELLPQAARSFGFGRPAGLEFVPEEPGKVPVPLKPGDATNLAIGQGGLLVTPLQHAGYMSALSNGGSVPRPLVVLRFQDTLGTVTRNFGAAVAEQGDIRAADLPIIRSAMRRVTADPVGTMYVVFHSSPIEFYGKSGTAETTSGNPDVWFMGGAPVGSPTIVASVVVEEKPNGLHSIDAAQAARTMMQAALASA